MAQEWHPTPDRALASLQRPSLKALKSSKSSKVDGGAALYQYLFLVVYIRIIDTCLCSTVALLLFISVSPPFKTPQIAQLLCYAFLPPLLPRLYCLFLLAVIRGVAAARRVAVGPKPDAQGWNFPPSLRNSTFKNPLF